jgi:hypothetical protein
MLVHVVTKVVPTGLFLSAVGLLSFVGCSSNTLQQACSDYVTASRNFETSCLSVVPEPDRSTLVSREIQSCVLSSGASGSTVDASYWEGCAAQASNGCQSWQCPPFPAGTRQTGESCLASVQCASLWCKGTVVTGAGGAALPGAVQCGTCAPLLSEGAPCNAATDACAMGLSCFSGACRAKGLQGAACVAWSDCAFPWVCRSNGVCDSVLPDGATCGSGYDCGSNTGCDVTTKQCTPVQYGQPDATCDGEVHRCEAGGCNKASGTCPTRLADGAACDPADPSKVCDVYARCFEGTCQIPDPATCK